ncbi:unnamed protein product, partial [Closterium sp. Naga37s-1]
KKADADSSAAPAASQASAATASSTAQADVSSKGAEAEKMEKAEKVGKAEESGGSKELKAEEVEELIRRIVEDVEKKKGSAALDSKVSDLTLEAIMGPRNLLDDWIFRQSGRFCSPPPCEFSPPPPIPSFNAISYTLVAVNIAVFLFELASPVPTLPPSLTLVLFPPFPPLPHPCPVTFISYTLVAINIAVFLFELASPEAVPGVITTSLPALLAAKVNPLIEAGEWVAPPHALPPPRGNHPPVSGHVLPAGHRRHAGIIHLSVGTFFLLGLGSVLEFAIGPLGLLAVYFSSGLAGNITSFLQTPDVTVGGTVRVPFPLFSPSLGVPPAPPVLLTHCNSPLVLRRLIGPVYGVAAAYAAFLIKNREVIGTETADSNVRESLIIAALFALFAKPPAHRPLVSATPGRLARRMIRNWYHLLLSGRRWQATAYTTRGSV